jgi:hypothetical protein
MLHIYDGMQLVKHIDIFPSSFNILWSINVKLHHLRRSCSLYLPIAQQWKHNSNQQINEALIFAPLQVLISNTCKKAGECRENIIRVLGVYS